MSSLTSKLAKLRPFKRTSSSGGDGGAAGYEDDFGFEVDNTTIAGGGHASRATDLTKHGLRVSAALRQLLVREGVLGTADAGLDDDGGIVPGTEKELTPALHAVVEASHINVPAEVTDRSHALPSYFISSSHNTYLLAHQLYGSSSAEAYRTALVTGTRCVEIDAWDNDDNAEEPKVTHGYTLVSHIPFRAVCETIRDVVDQEIAAASGPSMSGTGYGPGPVLVSLENHCGAHGQLRLVQIMKEIWGDRLLGEAITNADGDAARHVRLEEVGSKILVMVEYHFPNEPEDDNDGSSSDDGVSSSSESEAEPDEEKAARVAYKAQKQAAKVSKSPGAIIPELAALGVYAQSVKPQNNSWFASAEGMTNSPHHHLINVSETGLLKDLGAASETRRQIAAHNAKHLMRVFPKGTRISSQNLKPVPFWGVGAQVCGLNWQTFGASMQLNEALFSGTDGFVLKPEALRHPYATADPSVVDLNRPKGPTKKTLRLRIAGATDVPIPKSKEAKAKDGAAGAKIKPYVSCLLVQPAPALDGSPTKRKTSAFSGPAAINAGPNEAPCTDPVWDETLTWTYSAENANDELTFVRLLVKSDDAWAENPVLAVVAVRVLYAVKGEWRFVRLLDLRGRETNCALLVKWEIEDAE